jgi:hypothetical protein
VTAEAIYPLDHMTPAEAEGIDAATRALYERVRGSPPHAPFIRRIDELRRRPAPARRQMRATLAIAPGAFYREFSHTGADGRLLREQAQRLGCATAVIPTGSTGTLEENARAICHWLIDRPPEETIILGSSSKGGSDIKLALARPEAAAAFRNVAAWINVCGILSGSPAVNWLAARRWQMFFFRLLFWLRGWNIRVLGDLGHGPGTLLDFELKLPATMRLLHVIGFPMREHMTTPLARACHARVTPQGPNDGVVLLAEVCRLPGLIYPVWGADHYLRPSWDMRSLAGALLEYLGEELDLFVADESLTENN